ncbi:MAG: hypothetical protein JNM13_14260 [Hyphomicrobiaceae bacterium]|nr:hypothetical protein [Hyphomicrobiaceae bacterium]
MQNLTLENCVNDLCPVTGRPVSADALARYKGRVIGFASPADRDRFLGAYVAIEAAIKGEVELSAARERELTLAQAMEFARSARAQRWLAERAAQGFPFEARDLIARDPLTRATLVNAAHGNAAHSSDCVDAIGPSRRLPENLAGTCH